MKKITLVVFIAIFAFAFSVYAQDITTDKLLGKVDVSVASDYVFRGVKLSDESILNVEFSAEFKDVTVSAYNVYEDINFKNLFEIGYNINWNATSLVNVENLAVNIGANYYNYDKLGFVTTELCAGITYSDVLNYNLDVAYDIDEIEGLFWTVGVDYVWTPENAQQLSLIPSILIAYDARDNGVEDNFTYAEYGLAATYDFGYNVAGKLSYAYVDAIEDSYEDESVVKFGLAYNF